MGPCPKGWTPGPPSSPLEAAEIVIRYDATNLGAASDRVAIDNVSFGQVAAPE